MNNLREAAQAALEALDQGISGNDIDEHRAATQARNTLRAALAAPQPPSPHCDGGTHPRDDEPRDDELIRYFDKRGDDVGQGLDPYWKWACAVGWNAHKKLVAPQPPSPQPAQEPVAWMTAGDSFHRIPLYTHPPRSYTPMTDEEIDSLSIGSDELWYAYRRFARVVERAVLAKLGMVDTK